MSGKIKSKDLSYDSSLPPFLQRLHDQSAGRGDTDRQERPLARPKKAKDPNEDDGPTVIDESGETLSKEELAKLTSQDGIADTENVTGEIDPSAEPMVSRAIPNDEPINGEDPKTTIDNVTNGTAQKKRKLAKVVGDNESGNETKDQVSTTTKITKKAKKKAKPIKLAFDDDEGS